MIHAHLPEPVVAAYKTYTKKHTSIISPEKLLLNEKLLFTLMLSGVALTFITWALRKRK